MARKRLNQAQRERERLAFHYTSALDRADFAALSQILDMAERDPELERMIIEINSALTAIVPYEQGVIRSGHNHYEGVENMVSVPYLYADEPSKRKRNLLRQPHRWARIAAVITLLLFGGLIISMLSAPRGSVSNSMYGNGGPGGEPGGFGAQGIELTATSIIEDATATAAVMQMIVPTVPPLGMADVETCAIVADRPVEVFSLPNREARAIGGLPAGRTIGMIDVATSADGVTWYFIQAQALNVQGWVDASTFTEVLPDCVSRLAGVCPVMLTEATALYLQPEGEPFTTLPADAIIEVVGRVQTDTGEWLRVHALVADVRIEGAYIAALDLGDLLIDRCLINTPTPLDITATPFPATLMPPPPPPTMPPTATPFS